MRAEVAWLGPSVWAAPDMLHRLAPLSLGPLHELPESPATLIELFGAFPQLDAPNLYASAGASPEEFLNGLSAPAWAMWLDARLAKKVKHFPGQHERQAGFTRYLLSPTCPSR